MEVVLSLPSEGHRIILFSQFTSMLGRMQHGLALEGPRYILGRQTPRITG